MRGGGTASAGRAVAREPAAPPAEEPAAAGEPLKIAFFTDAQDNSYLQAAIEAAQEVASERGADLEVIDATWDANKQLSQVQDAVSSAQYDALVVESVDGEVLCEDLTAAAQNMVVSIYNAPICGNYEELYTSGTMGSSARTTISWASSWAKKLRRPSAAAQVTVAYVWTRPGGHCHRDHRWAEGCARGAS